MWIIQSLNHICLGSQWPMEAGHLGQSSCVCVCSVETCWWSLNDAWAEPSCRAVERIDLFLHQWPETSSSLPCRSCASTRLFFSQHAQRSRVPFCALIRQANGRQVPQASIYYEFVFSQLGGTPSTRCMLVCLSAWKWMWNERRKYTKLLTPHHSFMTDAPPMDVNLVSVATLDLIIKAKLFKSKLMTAWWWDLGGKQKA